MTAGELVVLLDEHDRPSGTALRSEVHSSRTPLHLAFSCYLLGPDGRLLVTRRAVTKRTWPGVWTNSFCGHPRPGEPVEEAVHRYAQHELGTTLRDLRCVLPDFRYRAVDPAGVVENELCPVYVAAIGSGLDPSLEEVAEHRWATLEELRAVVAAAPWALSPWLVAQLSELDRTGDWSAVP